MSDFSKTTGAFAQPGQLILDVVGEVVDQWRDEEGTWVTVVPHPRAPAAVRIRQQ